MKNKMIAAIAAMLALCFCVSAYAKTTPPPPPPVEPPVVVPVTVDVAADADASAMALAEAEANAAAFAAANSAGGAGGAGGNAEADGGVATASNEGIDNSTTTTTENNASTVVLVPNNNTESCLRVFGLAFGRNGESAAIGYPWRSKVCDFEQAADDAFAGGERELGWYWKCQNKNLYGAFKRRGASKEDAIAACVAKTVGVVTMIKLVEELRKTIDALEQKSVADRAACNKDKDAIVLGCTRK